MEILHLVVVLCALHLVKPLDRDISPIEHELRLTKRQDPDVIIPTGVTSGFLEARVNCTVEFPCVALNADLVVWTLLGVGSLSLPDSPGRSVKLEQHGDVIIATLVLDPVIPDHEDFYVCQIQGGNTPAVNIIVDVIEEPLLLEANTPVADISNATEENTLTLLCTTTTCLEGVSVEFYLEGPPDILVHQSFSNNSDQSFAYNHVIASNSAGNYFCQAVHTDLDTGVTIRSSREYFTIQGTPKMATQPPTDGSSDTSQPPSDGTTTASMATGSSTEDGMDPSQGGGTTSPLFQSALSLTLLLVTLVAVLMS